MYCTICSDRYPFHAPCVRAHDGLCHWCAEANLSHTPLDNPAHDAPPESVSLLEAYARRVLWEVSALPTTWLEDTPC